MFAFPFATESFAVALVNGLVLGLVLTGVVWIVLRVARSLNASTRYAVLALTLAAVIALPAVYARHAMQQPTHERMVELPEIEVVVAPKAPAAPVMIAIPPLPPLPPEVEMTEQQLRELEVHQRKLEEAFRAQEAQIRAHEAEARAKAEMLRKRIEIQVAPRAQGGAVEIRQQAEAAGVHETPAAVATPELMDIHPESVVRQEAALPVLLAIPAGVLDGPWVPFVFGAWAVVAMFLVLRVLVGVRRLYALKAGSTVAPLPWQIRFEKHLDAQGLRRNVRLATSDEVAVPLVAGLTNPHVLIPTALLDELTPLEFDQVVLHELAHVQRYDDWFKLAQKLAEAVFFFHPAVHFLGKQLDWERELACDDAAMQHARGGRKAYASCLARLVELTRWPSRLDLAPGACSSKGQIFERVRTVLDSSRNASSRLSRQGMLAAACGVMFVLVFATRFSVVAAVPTHAMEDTVDIVVPAPPAPPAAPMAEADTVGIKQAERALAEAMRRYEQAQQKVAELEQRATLVAGVGQQQPEQAAALMREMAAAQEQMAVAQHQLTALRGIEHVRTGDPDTHWRSTWSKDGVDYALDARGEVTFGDDDRSIVRIERGGSFKFSAEGRGLDRRVEVYPEASGLEYRYWENGRRATFDAQARGWFGDMLLEVIRQSGINAEERAERILRQRGVPGLLSEIDLLVGDYATRRYITATVKLARLDDSALLRLLERTARMRSDYEKRQILQGIAANHLLTEATRPAFFRVVGEMSSDYEKRQVLDTILARNTDTATRRAALAVAGDMNSDYEKRQVLQKAIRAGDSDAMVQEYLEASLSIGSDYEKRQVLQQVLDSDTSSPDLVRYALAAAGEMKSDYEKRQVLERVAPHMARDPQLYTAYLNAVKNMSSGYEQRVVLASLLKNQQLDARSLEQTVEIVANIASDYEKRVLLQQIMQGYAAEAYLRPAFFRIVRAINSDHEKRQILQDVLKEDRLPEAALVEAFAAVKAMGSDYEKAQLLVASADHLENANDRVLAAYVAAVESLKSDHEYNRVVSALAKKRGLRGLLGR